MYWINSQDGCQKYESWEPNVEYVQTCSKKILDISTVFAQPLEIIHGPDDFLHLYWQYVTMLKTCANTNINEYVTRISNYVSGFTA